MDHHPQAATADINVCLARHERKELLRFLTCGGVDDGKSTLIGRLLHDSKLIYEDQLAAIAADSLAAGNPRGKLDLSLLVDGLQAEREQGITIDVAYRYFSTARRKFIIADTPGHEQYTRNMATGASNCELAVILVDARRGVLSQTKRHSYIVSLLGIRQIIVAVNKMDLVDFAEPVFNRIREDYLAFAAGLDGAEPLFAPLSAKHGDNVVHSSPAMPWHRGPPLLEMLETIPVPTGQESADFRFPVQYVNRPDESFRGYCGSIASGAARRGDEVVVLPSGRKSKIKSIATFDGDLKSASAGAAVALTLEDDIDVGRGDLLAHPGSAPAAARRLDATVVWMAEQPLLPGARHEIKLGAHTLAGTVKTLRHAIDISTLAERAAARLELNEIGRVEIELEATAYFDDYRQNRATGRFILIDRLSNATVGAGMIHGHQTRRSAAASGGGAAEKPSEPSGDQPEAQSTGGTPAAQAGGVADKGRRAGFAFPGAANTLRRLLQVGSFAGWPALCGVLLAVAALQFQQLRDIRDNLERLESGAAATADDFHDAITAASASVVSISATRVNVEAIERAGDDRIDLYLGEQESLGSGIIIDPRGFILTNLHVVDTLFDAFDATVTLNDGRRTPATVIAWDETRDLAVLHINMDDLAPAPLGDENRLAVGDAVFSIGYPHNIGQSVSRGIVSSLSRDNAFSVALIQTDAAINPGSSGGALIDGQGGLVGVNSSIFSESGNFEGIGFATPATVAVGAARELVTEAIAANSGYLGVLTGEALTARSSELFFGVDNIRGMLVESVDEGGAAARAGIAPGDVITAINDTTVVDDESIVMEVRGKKPGDVVRVQIYREGRTLEFETTLGFGQAIVFDP